jgi:tetratricopeptide (TPR) repeat protein
VVRSRRRATRSPGTAPRRLRIAALATLALLALWPPFAGGLYGDRGQFLGLWQAVLAVGLVFLLGLREKTGLPLTPARAAVAALWLAYVASLFVAVAPRQAIQEVVKFGLYSLAFLATSELVRSAETANQRPGGSRDPAGGPRGAVTPPRAIVLGDAGSVVLALWVAVALFAFLSLVAAVGLLPYDVSDGLRLFTFLGYPNSAGSLVGAAFLLGLAVRRRWSGPAASNGRRPVFASRLVSSLTGVGQWVLLVAFILTMSRGAWLVFPFALGLTIWLWPSGRRLGALGDLVLGGLGAVAVSAFLARYLGRPSPGAFILAAGLALAVGLAWAGRWFVALPARAQRRWVIGGAAATVVLAVFLVVSGSLPDSLVSRIKGFSLSDQSAAERIIWSRDALDIIGDYPVLGVGGGGWASVYFQYQGYGYATREVHNDFLEIGVETGSVGLAAFLGLVAASAWAVWRTARRGAASAVPAALAGAAAMLLLHSALDFNLALGSVGIFLWMTLGALDGLYLAGAPAPRAAPAPTGPKRPAFGIRGGRTSAEGVLAPRLAVLVLALLLSLVSVSLFGAWRLGTQAMRLAVKSPTLAHALFERACRLDPWSAELRANRAILAERLYGSTGRVEFRDEAMEQLARAAALDPRSPAVHARYGVLALRYGVYDIAEREILKSLTLQPNDASQYERRASFYVVLGQALLTDGDTSGAKAKLEAAYATLGLLEAQATKVSSDTPPGHGLPSLTAPLALHCGQAATLLGRLDEARRLLEHARAQPASPVDRETGDQAATRHAEAALWLSLVAGARGDAAQARMYLEEARAGLPGADEKAQELRTMMGKV